MQLKTWKQHPPLWVLLLASKYLRVRLGWAAISEGPLELVGATQTMLVGAADWGVQAGWLRHLALLHLQAYETKTCYFAEKLCNYQVLGPAAALVFVCCHVDDSCCNCVGRLGVAALCQEHLQHLKR